VDDETFQRAAYLSRQLSGWIKTAEVFFFPMKDSAHKTWKAIVEREKSVVEPKKALKLTLGTRMAEYDQEQGLARLAEEARVLRERERLEREAQLAAEAMQRRLRADEEDRILQAAMVAEEQGDTASATALIDQPVVVPTVVPVPVFVPPVQMEAPQAKGVSFSSVWSAELTSLTDLVKAAATGNQVAMSCLAFDQVRANGLARTLKAALTTVPGVKAVEKRITTSRAMTTSALAVIPL